MRKVSDRWTGEAVSIVRETSMHCTIDRDPQCIVMQKSRCDPTFLFFREQQRFASGQDERDASR